MADASLLHPAVAGSRLDGKRAVVTGASGAIGSVIVEYLGALGAEVWSLDLGAPAAPEADARFIRTDVTDRASVQAAAAELARSGGVDLLVNCHGLQIRRSFLDCTEDQWTRILDVNVHGAVRTCQAFGAGLIERRGAIVNVSSVNGSIAARTGTAYNVSKAALSHLTRQLALEWAPKVRVNAVAPIAVLSAMTADVLDDLAYRARRAASIPLERLATPQDVAAGVAFLLSNNASMITGHVLMIDGGHSVQ